jgi:hypothetical protein
MLTRLRPEANDSAQQFSGSRLSSQINLRGAPGTNSVAKIREKNKFVETEIEESLNVPVSTNHDEPNR